MEIEAKFSFRDESAFPAWLSAPSLGRFTLGPARLRHTADQYLDSDDSACMRGGYACRIRTSGVRTIATLKSVADALGDRADAVRRREEYEVELLPPRPRTPAPPVEDGSLPAWKQPALWPESEARALALRLLEGRPLRPLARVWQERFERPVLDGERRVATLSLDRVRFEGEQEPMLELEVELEPEGTEDDLVAIAGALRGDPAFEAQARSKLQRALAAHAAPAATGDATPSGSAQPEQPAHRLQRRDSEPRPVRLRADTPMPQAGRAVLRVQFQRLADAIPALEGANAVEALHDARVAVRRIRTLLRLFKGVYPQRERRRHLEALKQAGELFGAVRDLDVQLDHALGVRAPTEPAPGLDRYIAVLQRERVARFAALKEYLGGEGFAVWRTAFQALLADDATGRGGHERLCDRLPALAWKRYGAVRAYQPLVATASLATLHELRKELKQLRYLLEFFAPLLGRRTDKLIKQIIAVQDALGDLHDADVRVRRLLQAPGEADAGLESYQIAAQAEPAACRRAFEVLWPSITRRRFRRRLARCLAEL